MGTAGTKMNGERVQVFKVMGKEVNEERYRKRGGERGAKATADLTVLPLLSFATISSHILTHLVECHTLG